MVKELQRLLHRHVQHLIDILPLIVNLQRLAVVPLAMADLAGYIDIRQEVHLNLDDAVPAAGLAASALDIE